MKMMKQVLLLLLSSMASVAWAGELKLTMHGAGIAGKNLYVAVHSSAQDFPMRYANALKSTVVARENATELLIPNVHAGEYAVAVFADMNGNGVLDSNFVGIPKEPVGVSRDAKGRFGPPKFADAAFKVGEGVTTQTITIK